VRVLPQGPAQRIICVSALLLAAVFSGGSSATGGSDTQSPQKAFERFVAAFNALDWDSFRACLADDASVFNPEIPEVTSLHRLDGRESIEKAFRAVFGASSKGGISLGGSHIIPERVRIQRFNDTAIVTFEFRRSMGSFGRRTLVLHRQGDTWLIVHIHASNVHTHP